jgi:hypothetical protein
MVLIPVLCPHCHSDQVIKGGKTKAGRQRVAAAMIALEKLCACRVLGIRHGDAEEHEKYRHACPGGPARETCWLFVFHTDILTMWGFQALAPVNLRLASTDFLTNACSGL